MSLADKIRKEAFELYIKPARELGKKIITIRAGYLHNRMGLKNRLPAVCGALGTEIFQRQYNVTLIKRQGATNGANVYFTFKI